MSQQKCVFYKCCGFSHNPTKIEYLLQTAPINLLRTTMDDVTHPANSQNSSAFDSDLGSGDATIFVKPLILDTNVILDLFVFNDPEIIALKPTLLAGLVTKQLNWIATADMRIELQRVLTYPKITPRMAFYQVTATDVLAKFDELATLVDPAPKAKWICKDPDDQCFIDLAVQHKATLLSKDQAVLCMAKRLLTAGAVVHTAARFIYPFHPTNHVQPTHFTSFTD